MKFQARGICDNEMYLAKKEVEYHTIYLVVIVSPRNGLEFAVECYRHPSDNKFFATGSFKIETFEEAVDKYNSYF